MRDRGFRFMLKLASLCSLACIASCGPNDGFLNPRGLSSITVLVKDNTAYPIFQFTCSEVEPSGSSESCPNGFGCDAQHYHGNARPIGMLADQAPADIRLGEVGTANDPDQCHCGWGKTTDVDIRTVFVFQSDLVEYAAQIALPLDLDTGVVLVNGEIPVNGLTLAEHVSVDPCGN